MTMDLLEKLLEQTDSLTPAERLTLANRLIERTRHEISTRKRSRSLRELRATAGCSLYNEDAQNYITRIRLEDTKQRSQG